MNYKPIVVQKFVEFSKEAKEMTFGEVLYSILRKQVLKSKPEDVKTSWLREIDDKEFYTAIEKALNLEIEYKEE